MPKQAKPRIKCARSLESLETLLDSIASGVTPKPEWIRTQGECRLDKLDPAALSHILTRLHSSVLRGFKAKNVKIKGKKSRSKFWRTVARHGFHDFSDFGWTKCYDSPFVANYDYITPYRKGGLEAIDPYMVYSAVLGTHDYSVEDFVKTNLCQGVDTILEPMSGTAEFCYHGHFRYPEFRYLMFDLDEDARRHVEALPWLEGVERQYVIANVLDEEIWQHAKSYTSNRSLCYIGKQSHHLFDAKQLYRLLDIATRHVDYFMLETPQVSLVSDMDDADDLTRPEMEDAGFETHLINEDDGTPNSFTNQMSFRLDVSDDKGERTLFQYPSWTNWSQPTLFAFAQLLDLRVHFYHADVEEFIPVEDQEQVEESDCLDNVTFMMFTRHGEE